MVLRCGTALCISQDCLFKNGLDGASRPLRDALTINIFGSGFRARLIHRGNLNSNRTAADLHRLESSRKDVSSHFLDADTQRGCLFKEYLEHRIHAGMSDEAGEHDSRSPAL